ncbi:major facilitator superfamily domain-containing protein [Tricladium varicosporioides]|nr:major facilitator superfamily domain-containing protein [Hymenoscyphus varicosporioides]
MPLVEDELVPGTVYILNEQDTVGGNYSRTDIILRPSPSNNPADPLRWPKWRKLYALSMVVVYSAIMGAVTNWDGVIYVNVLMEYNTTTMLLNVGQALLILMLGVANMIFTPLSDKLGRRFVYLSSMAIVLISHLVLALSKNISSYIVGHTLLGIGAAPFEALPAISISDIFFAHERGTMLGGYVFGLAFGSFVGPICAGYIAVNQGSWRWVYWWGLILSAAVLFLMFATMEETCFIRSDELSESSTTIPTTGIPSKLGVEENGDQKKADNSQVSDENVGEVFPVANFRFLAPAWKLFPGTPSDLVHKVWRPLTVSRFPPVLWCGINYGTCVSWLAVLATTVSEIFSIAPYNMKPNAVGLLFIAPLIGSLIGAYFAGPLNDKLSLFLAHRNSGFREPEFRLWAFLPTSLILPGGLIIYGVTAARGLPWIAPAVGMGMVGFGLSVGGGVTMAYILDCYKDIAGEVVTTIILIRNVIGFGITFGIQPWINGMGLQNTFVVVGLLSFVVTGFSMFFIWKGKDLRVITKQKYLSYHC